MEDSGIIHLNFSELRQTHDIGLNNRSLAHSTSKIKSIGSCGVCHDSSRGESNPAEFAEEHGGTSPEKAIGCHTCHTTIPTNTAKWPHAYA